jgi:uncharacterized protein YbjT (DUF2867 family)
MLKMETTDPNTRKALLVGATGLIGGHCLQTLCDNPNYSEVTAIVRKPILKTHRKLKVITSTFDNLQNDLSNIQAHDVYCCLGTTIKKSGSQEAFKKIDFGLVITLAELMRKQGSVQFLVISSVGANKDSKVFYNRTKGEMEEALKEIDFPFLRIIRPSLLLGKRDEFRFGEKIGAILTPVLKPFLVGSLKKYAPIEAESVAHFMVKVAHEASASESHVYESDMIR